MQDNSAAFTPHTETIGRVHTKQKVKDTTTTSTPATQKRIR